MRNRTTLKKLIPWMVVDFLVGVWIGNGISKIVLKSVWL